MEGFFSSHYKECIDMYSFIHGEIIVDLMAEILRRYLIKHVPIDVGGCILAFISSETIDKMYNFDEIKSIDNLMPEIIDYITSHRVRDDGKIIKIK